jgi:predicted ATPase
MIHLQTVRYLGPPADERDEFPFAVPAVRALSEITFDAPVTFFSGENGSGKSTVLEAVAVAAGLVTVGSESADRDPSLARQRTLARRLALGWAHRTATGWFLRAEDFFGFAKRTAALRDEMRREAAEIDEAYERDGRSDYARVLATGPMRGSAADIERRYGGDLDARSHGEGFLALFGARFRPGGLYLIDEPEAALSPQSQLGLLAMMLDMVDQQRAQFVIATHSPILLAYPGATIVGFDDGTIARVAYEDLPGVRLTRDFLAAPEHYLRRLRSDGSRD